MAAYTHEERRLLDQCLVSTFRARGPGGQHRNVTESAVRLVHRPTGLVVTSSSLRSQYRNKRAALAELQRRLEARRRRRKPRVATRPGPARRRARLEAKRRRSKVKDLRRRVDSE